MAAYNAAKRHRGRAGMKLIWVVVFIVVAIELGGMGFDALQESVQADMAEFQENANERSGY